VYPAERGRPAEHHQTALPGDGRPEQRRPAQQ
jgi:hypothetical protein